MKIRNIINVLLGSLFLMFLMSCTAHKKLPYLKNGEELTQEQLLASGGFYEAKIMPKDVISITVNSQTPGLAADFNLPVVPSSINDVVHKNVLGTASALQNYIVDTEGYIDFPVLGRLKLGGLTKSQATSLLSSQIYPRYINEKPIVNIRFVTFKVSVLGEVARPGVYEALNEQMTIFDALANAGDMTIYGKRNNVMLVRTNDDGSLAIHRIDLQDKNLLLNKELFYLQQNDKLYVETNKAKGNNSQIGSFEALSLSAISIAISVIAMLLR